MALTPEQKDNVFKAFNLGLGIIPGGWMALFDDPELAPFADDAGVLTTILLSINPDFLEQETDLDKMNFLLNYMLGGDELVPQEDIDILTEPMLEIMEDLGWDFGTFAAVLFDVMVLSDWDVEGLEGYANAAEKLNNQMVVAAYADEQGLDELDFAVLQGILAGVTNDPMTVDLAKEAINALLPPMFTLEQALEIGAENLPENYKINPDEVFEPTVDIATAEEVFPQVVAILEGSLNQPALEDVFVWSIADTAENLLANQDNPVLVGAASFSLTDPAGNLTVPNAEAKEFLLGAANADQYIFGIQGNTITLTTATDIVGPDVEDVDFATTENNDTITAVASALSSARTLNADDSIDGGDGFDTLKVDMQGNFAGFSEAGGLVNVENIVLTNTGSIARTFNATGVEGAEIYDLNGLVNLSKLDGTGADINLNGQQSGSISIGYAKDSVAAGDVQSIGFNGVGSSKANVTVEVNNVGELALAATGNNWVALKADTVQDITTSGQGSLALGVGAVAKALNSVDAAAMEGDFTLNAVAGNDLAINATLAGSEGASRLNLSATGAVTTQYAMSGFETLALGALGGKLTFSAVETSDIETIIATKAMDNHALFSGLGDIDMAFEVEGNNGFGDAKITTAHTGTSTVNVTATGDNQANNVALVLSATASLDLNISDEMNYTGKLIADKAESVVATIDGQLNNELIVSAATSGLFTFNGDSDSLIILNAGKMTNLEITTTDEGDVTLDTDSNVSKVESLSVTVASDSTFDADTNNINFTILNSASFAGGGAVVLNKLGSSDQDFGITINAENLAGGLTIGDINVGKGQAIELNVAGVLGDVSLFGATVADDAGALTGSIIIDANGTSGDLNFGFLEAKNVTVDAEGALGTLNVDVFADTANISGVNLDANVIAVTANVSATVVGGLDDDTITVTENASAGQIATFSLSGGLGADTFEFDATTNAGALRATITDFSAGEDELDGITVADTALTDNDAINNLLTFLNSVDGISGVVATDLSNTFADADAAGAVAFIFEYAGTAHYVGQAVAGGAFTNDDIFITLNGVTGLDGLDLGAGGDIFAA